MKLRKIVRSVFLAVLILSMMLSCFPTAFAAKGGARQQVTVNTEDLIGQTETADPEADAEALAEDLADKLCAQYGVEDVSEADYGDPELPCLPEDQGPAKKGDNLNTSYVFLDFKIGGMSRSYNWQGKDATVDFSSSNPTGLLHVKASGLDSRVYMGIENSSAGKKRLGNYVIQEGDIVQVRINSISANELFVSGGTSTDISSYLTICTSGTINTTEPWASCKSRTLKGTTSAQTITFDPTSQIGNTLYAIRFDPLNKMKDSEGNLASYDFPTTNIYIDYIYVGPADKAPVNVVYRNEENTANLSHTMTTVTNADGSKKTYSTNTYVGYGQTAPYFDNGKKNTETETTRTIWGYQVHQQINGAWKDMGQFITDPTNFKCYYPTRFVLKSVTVPKTQLESTQTYDTGISTEDDNYVLTVDGFNTAQIDMGSTGTPLDVTIVLDRSGSEAEIYSGKKTFTTKDAMITYLESLDKSKWEGYYRASAWRKKNNEGGSGAKAYVYYMPMRYYNGEWQCRVIPDYGVYSGISGKCSCDTKHSEYGIYPYNATGMNSCSHVTWVSMSHAYSLYEALLKNEGYSSISSAPFQIGVSKLGVMQNAAEIFVEKLFNSTKYLDTGARHSVSILAYGQSVYNPNYPYYNYMNYVKDGKNADMSMECTFLDEGGFDTFLKTLRKSYVFGSSRVDAAFQLLAGQVSSIETAYDSNRTKPYISASKYIRSATTSRKRVVVLLTDGLATDHLDFTVGVANDAVKASHVLKSDANTKVYALGFMSGLNASVTSIGGLTNSSDNVNKANDFLNAISSRYRSAQVYNTGTSLTKGEYYITSSSAGSVLASSLENEWTGSEAELTASNPSGPGSLWLYEDYGREWKPDEMASVKIYAEAYVGDGKYSGTRVLIGEHKVKDHTKSESFSGNGYKLHYYYDDSDQSFAYALQWTDAKTAFLRETALSTGSQAKALTKAALDVSKGYKVYMEMPVEVDRNNTLGGNNIPLTTSASGCYQAKDSNDTEMGKKLYSYYQPNANVYTGLDDVEVTDYYLSEEDLKAMLAGETSVTLQEIFDGMVRYPNDLRPANEMGLSMFDYCSYELKVCVQNEDGSVGTVLYHIAVNRGETTLFEDICNLGDQILDLTKDQTFVVTCNFENSSHSTDDYGRLPYMDVNGTFYVHYYVPEIPVDPTEPPVDPTEPTEPSEPEVVQALKPGHSLNLQSSISINYVVSAETMAQYDSYEIKCYVGDRLSQPVPVEKDGYIYFVLTDVNALNMSTMIRAEIYAYKDGKVYVSPLDEYSVATYVTNMLSKNIPDAFRKVCVNLLRYGAASQTYKSFNTDNLADACLTEEQKNWITDLETVAFGNNNTVWEDMTDDTVKFIGKTLVLDSTVCIKLVVDASAFAGTEEDLELRATFINVKGEEEEIRSKATVYNAAKKQYMFVIDQLNASELREVLSCRVYAGDRAVSRTLLYSADTYGNGKAGALLDLCKALFAYADAAKAFFAS